MRKKLKIAIFHLAFLYSGGGERLVLEEALGLRKLGHEVDVYSPIVDTKNCFPELLKKVKVIRLLPHFPNWIPDIELIAILISCAITPFFFYKFKSYDVYLGANQPGPWIAYLLSRINNVPYAVYLSQPTRLIHPRLIDQKTGLKITDGITILSIFTFLFRPLIAFADVKSITSTPLVFSDGVYMKGILEEVYDIHTINVPGATHIHNKIKQAKQRFVGKITIGRNSIPKPYLLISNRHFPQKKFEYGIQVLNLLHDNSLSLIVCGKETSYTKQLKKLSKDKQVFFVGLVNEKDLKKLYQNCAVYIYPSPEEDFGLGVIEAMSYCIPVVAWGNGGPTGIITPGVDGMLAQPFRLTDFTQKIRQLLTNRKLYMKIANNGYKKVKRYFSFESHNKTIERYLILLTKNQPF